MIPAAEVKVNIDENAIQEYIQKQLDKQLHQKIILVDINGLVKMTSMSARYLEDEILSDPRVRMYERRKRKKRWWLYEPVIEAIKNIVNDW